MADSCMLMARSPSASQAMRLRSASLLAETTEGHEELI